MRKGWAVIAVLLALLWPPARVAADELPAWERETAGWTQHWAGLFFPAEVAGMQQGPPHNYDDAGHDASIGYDSTDPRLHITLYVYTPRHPRLGDQLDDELRSLRTFHRDLRIGPAGPMKLPWLGADPHPEVKGAYMRYTEKHSDYCSFLILAPFDGKVFKVRASWPQRGPDLPVVMERISAVMRAVTRAR